MYVTLTQQSESRQIYIYFYLQAGGFMHAGMFDSVNNSSLLLKIVVLKMQMRYAVLCHRNENVPRAVSVNALAV